MSCLFSIRNTLIIQHLFHFEVVALGLYCTSQFCFLIHCHQGEHQTKRAIIDEILKETVINYREYACGALCGLMC